MTAVSKSSVTVNNGINTVKFEDADIYSGIAKDDYVLFVDEGNRSSKDMHEITKLDVTSAEVTGTRTGEAKVDGAWVKLASGVSVDTGSTYDMIIVGGVMLFADETSASSKDILYISGTKAFDQFVGENNGTVEAKAYFLDKTSDTITVSKVAGEKITDASGVKSYALYTYSKLSDGTYDIKALSNTNKAGYDSVKSGSTSIYANQKIDGKAPSDDAVILFKL